MFLLLRLFSVVGMLLIVVGVVHAQTQFGSVAGIVTDPAQARVPGAEVKATNEATGLGFSTISTASGDYLISGLLPGTYTVTGTIPGFKDSAIKGVVVAAGATARTDIAMQIGATSEMVTVEASSAQLQTESAAVTVAMPKEYLDRGSIFQQNTQNISDTLVMYLPGQTYLGGGRNVSAYGSRSSDRKVTIDGAATGMVSGGGLRQPRGTVEDLQTPSLNANAENQTANTSQLITKKGTNGFHGAIWAELQNPAINGSNIANPPGSPRDPGISSWNRGFILGGPVYIPKLYDGRNKTFFYSTFQKALWKFPWNVPLAMPTNAMKAIGTPGGGYDLSATGRTICDPTIERVGGVCTPFPGNVIPASRVSPIAQGILSKYYPNINGSSFFLGNQEGNGAGLYTNPFWDIVTRIDHQLTANDLLTGTWVRNSANTSYNTNTGGNTGPNTTGVFDQIAILNFLNFSENHIFSPSLLNEANYGVRMGGHSKLQERFDGANTVASMGLPATPNAPSGIGGGPTLSISGAASLTWSAQNEADQRIHTIRDVVSYTKGRFNTRGGVEAIIQSAPVSSYAGLFGNYSFDGTFTGVGYGDFLLGLPRSTSRSLFPGEIGQSRRQIGFFVTENVRATRKLTFDLGVRVSLLYSPIDPGGRGYNFDRVTGKFVVRSEESFALLNPGLSPELKANIVTAEQAGFPDRLVSTQVHLDPRLGLAFQIHGDTVVRAAYGIYGALANVAAPTGGIFTAGSESNTNLLTCAGGVCSPSFTLANPFPGGGTAAVTGLPVSGINPNLRSPRTHQWNMTVEHRLPADVVVRTSYVGTASRQLPFGGNINLPEPSTIPFSSSRLVYPSYIFSAAYTDSGGNASYHGLDIEFKRAWSRGWTMLGGYNFQKCLSDVDEGTGVGAAGPTIEGPYSRSRDKGRCNGFSPNFFRAMYTWDIPVGQGRGYLSHPQSMGKKVLSQIVGGWTMSGAYLAKTGNYYTPLWGGAFPAGSGPNTGQSGLRPDLIGGCNPNLEDRDHFKIFEYTCFTTPPNGRYGNAGKGSIQSLGTWTYDAGLYKYFYFSGNENMPRFRLAANAMNAFNHAGWGPTANYNVNAPVGVVGRSDSNANLNGSTANLGGWRMIYIEMRVEW